MTDMDGWSLPFLLLCYIISTLASLQASKSSLVYRRGQIDILCVIFIKSNASHFFKTCWSLACQLLACSFVIYSYDYIPRQSSCRSFQICKTQPKPTTEPQQKEQKITTLSCPKETKLDRWQIELNCSSQPLVSAKYSFIHRFIPITINNLYCCAQ